MMEEAMEARVSSRGGRIWTTVQGQGVPLLLCNGGPGCCDCLGSVAEMLDGGARHPL